MDFSTPVGDLDGAAPAAADIMGAAAQNLEVLLLSKKNNSHSQKLDVHAIFASGAFDAVKGISTSSGGKKTSSSSSAQQDKKDKGGRVLQKGGSSISDHVKKGGAIESDLGNHSGHSKTDTGASADIIISKKSTKNKMDDSSNSVHRRRESGDEMDGSHPRRKEKDSQQQDNTTDGSDKRAEGSERRRTSDGRHRRRDGADRNLGPRRRSNRSLGRSSHSGDGPSSFPEHRERRRGSKPRSKAVNGDNVDGSAPRLKRSGTSSSANSHGPGGTRKESSRGVSRRKSDKNSKRNSETPTNRNREGGRRSSDNHKRESEKGHGTRRSTCNDGASRRPSRDIDTRRRERRERNLRMKETYIPPPPSRGGDAGEEQEEEGPASGHQGPSDVAPPKEQRVHRHRRASVSAPRDHAPKPEEPKAEEDSFDTTWQRGPPRRTRARRSVIGAGAADQSSSPAAANARRPGRASRGAGVRHSQIASMVLLHDSFEQSQELAEVQEDEKDEEKEEEEPDLDSSNPELKAHHKRSFKPALKVAAKASTAVAKTGTKATVAVAKSGAHATVAVGKAGAKAMKGVLGFGRKKKGHKMVFDSSTAGLIIEDLEEDDNVGQWNMVDEQPELHVAEH